MTVACRAASQSTCDAESHADVGQQGQGQPLEHADVARVRKKHLQQQRDDAECRGEQGGVSVTLLR